MSQRILCIAFIPILYPFNVAGKTFRHYHCNLLYFCFLGRRGGWRLPYYSLFLEGPARHLYDIIWLCCLLLLLLMFYSCLFFKKMLCQPLWDIFLEIYVVVYNFKLIILSPVILVERAWQNM